MRILPALAAASLLFLGPAAPAFAVEPSAVTIDDQADILTPEEESQLKEDASNVTLPESVTAIDFVTFESNDDNLNDTVRFYTGDHGLHDASGEKYADGHLIVAVGMDPRRMGVYAGEDVAGDLNLRDEKRLTAITEEMRGLLADEKYDQGMLRGVQAAADTNLTAKDSNGGHVGGIIGGTLGVLGLGAAGAALAATRKKKAKKAREDWDYILAHHGDIAQRLDQINVRAHSLSSPLANDTLRQQWEEIRSRFVDAHSRMTGFDGLTSQSPDSKFRDLASRIADARAAVEATVNAESNIEELARMEHGNTEVRRRELTDLHEDVLAATTKAEGDLKGKLEALDARVLELRKCIDAPDFMDTYAGILGDYKVLIDALQDQLYAASNIEREDHSAATLADAAWRPGVGSYYVPYVVINDWHQSDVAAHAQASSDSGGVSTGYSSGGFSGSGGSSSF